MSNLDGLYIHLLDEYEVEQSIFPRYKPRMFNIVENLDLFRRRRYFGFIYLSLCLDNGAYHFNFGYDHGELDNRMSKFKRHSQKTSYKNTFETNPRKEGEVEGSYSLAANTVKYSDDYEEYFALRLSYIPTYRPNLILELTNVSIGLCQEIEMIKVGSPKYPFNSEILPLKL